MFCCNHAALLNESSFKLQCCYDYKGIKFSCGLYLAVERSNKNLENDFFFGIMTIRNNNAFFNGQNYKPCKNVGRF